MPSDFARNIDKLAKLEGLSRSELVRKALAYSFRDGEPWREIQKVWKKNKSLHEKDASASIANAIKEVRRLKKKKGFD